MKEVHKEKMLMRLCAFALLGDGKIDDAREEKKVIISIIKKELYEKNPDADQKAEEWLKKHLSILTACDSSENDAEVKSLFLSFDEDTKKREKRILKELVYLIGISQADNKLLDVEREGFRLICKLHKLGNATSIWSELLQKLDGKNPIDASNDQKILNTIPLNFRTGLKIEDFKEIERIISFYGITGALQKSASYVLERERTKRIAKLNSRNRLITKYSFQLFCGLALWLFLRVPACEISRNYFAPDLHQSQHETFYGVVSDSVQSIMIDQISKGLRNLQYSYDLNSVLADKIALHGGNMMVLRDKITTQIYDNELHYKEIALCRLLGGFVGILICAIASVVIFILYTIKRKKEHVNSKYYVANLEFYLKRMLWALLLGTLLCYDIGILFMMIAIEWLIFMRETKHVKTTNSKMLIVMVAVAIITDIAYGLVNASLLTNNEIELMTIAAPVFLGCICFLFGKWLEDNRDNTHSEFEQMKEIITTLDKTNE